MAFKDTIAQIKDFDYEDPNKLGVWPLPTKILVCLFIVAAVLAGTYYFKIKAINESLVREQAEERSLRKTFETRSAQAANLAAYRAQMEEMQQSFESLLARLPSDTEVPGLLEDIDARSVESGLGDLSLELQPQRDAEYYVELPINISVRGGYHDFGGFVSGVAGMPRIVTLHNFSINQAKEGGDLLMEIQAKTYHYQGGGENEE
ncbi:type 4a pilus biogenesis protein PilO [Gilvimarinus xylanilyticus]|uniref:Type 4a pilus biogenesis protein PilO n=1 Tax=Gilvimarinus xylanilyticus TaxID=2944139 RepID=A0A9X2KX46_9GAMM|nr:type 4a pilus biogenesis protein PilO [Gilvimarinus xylanilyticus]MCP8900735.1 type 4a pilus biogenesis protein PilO [Gilvimarinus xylanilyticus]